MKQSIEEDLTLEIAAAAKIAISRLFEARKETFYYCSLITDGLANAPILTAWSHEALEKEINKYENKALAHVGLKWSYADSPYVGFGDEHFDVVKKLFLLRHKLFEQNPDKEFELRLRAMARAMSILDSAGLFGQGTDRNRIVINAEVMPPDAGNTNRALRLNPAEALTDWLDEAAEE